MSQSVYYERDDRESPDFSAFVTDPQVPSDVILTNGTDSFAFHKVVLRKVSTVFCDILDGDSGLFDIEIGEDITVAGLKILQKFVYTKRDERKALFRYDLPMTALSDTVIQVKDAGVHFLNGVYTASGKRDGVSKFIRQHNDLTFEVSRVPTRHATKNWWISRVDVSGPEIDYYTVRHDGKLPPQNDWKRCTNGRDPIPTVFCNDTKECQMPWTVSDILSLHTLIAKYDLKIAELNDYIVWLYSNYDLSRNNFLTLTEDAQDNGMDSFVFAASRRHSSKFDLCTVNEYPQWFITHLFEHESDREDFTTIVGVVLRKAMEENDEPLTDFVRSLMSDKGASFKARVLDAQLKMNTEVRCSGSRCSG